MSEISVAALDEVLTSAAEAVGAPGAQAVLLRDGDVVWQGCHGVTETGRANGAAPITPSTVFCLASLGKSLVSALTLHLVERGVLAVDATLASLGCDDIPGASRVSVEMLLRHTAGYPDVYETPALQRLMPPDGEPVAGADYEPERPFTWEMIATALAEPIEPGVRWEYSNTGYIVLTEVLVRLVGGPAGLAETWRSFVAAAGSTRPLTSDLLTLDRDTVPPGRLARGYVLEPDGTLVDPYADHLLTGVPSDLFGLPFGDGLFAGTALGVGLFLDALHVRRSLLRPETVRLMTSRTPQAATADVPDPDLRTYGMGSFETSTAGGRWHGHRGGYGGFTTAAGSEASSGQTLVVLVNVITPERPAREVWRRLEELV